MGKSYMKTLVLIFLLGSAVFVAISAFCFADVTEGFWVSKAPVQQARADLGVAVVNGKIYAIGGVINPPSWNQAVGTNEEYNPTTDTWTFKKPMPTNRSQFGIAVYQNKIYCIGGSYGTVSFVDGHVDRIEVHAVKVNEVYDPATDTWETKVAMPSARAGVYAQVIGGKIYVLGGNSSVIMFMTQHQIHGQQKRQYRLYPLHNQGGAVHQPLSITRYTL